MLILLAVPGFAPARQWARPVGPGQWQVPAVSQARAKTLAEPTTSTSLTTETFTLNRIHWIVTYEDPAGVGFMDDQQGTARRAVVRDVLTTISHTLDYSTGTLHVGFGASQTDGAGYLAYAGTPFPTTGSLFSNGAAFDHLTTGVDPTPLADLICRIDFGYPLHAGSGPPPPGQYDLATVLLHEFTHGMGLVSLAMADGRSNVSLSNPGVFSVWDGLMRTGSGVPPWGEPGHFTGPTAWLTGVGEKLYFGGIYATDAFGKSRPPIFTPEFFQSGSSLSHFDPLAVSDSIMTPYLLVGEVRRAYGRLDKAALRDIGWRVPTVNAAKPVWSHYR